MIFDEEESKAYLQWMEEFKKKHPPLPHPIEFGRWILKHAETTQDKDGSFCWKYGGKEVDTHELFKAFKENPF